MNKEDKELLLKDLCARLPYKIMVKVNDTQGIMDEIDIPNERIFVSNLNPFLYGGARASWFTVNGDKIYPYLRPMSSMTEKEICEFQEILGHNIEVGYDFVNILDSSIHTFSFLELQALFDWLNAHHFDYRNLIERGLAIDCTGLNVY